jgi:hypothetical protein
MMIGTLFGLDSSDIMWICITVISCSSAYWFWCGKDKGHDGEQAAGGVGCGGCGRMNPPASNFCNGCGTRFAPQQQQSSGHPGGV